MENEKLMSDGQKRLLFVLKATPEQMKGIRTMSEASALITKLKAAASPAPAPLGAGSPPKAGDAAGQSGRIGYGAGPQNSGLGIEDMLGASTKILEYIAKLPIEQKQIVDTTEMYRNLLQSWAKLSMTKAISGQKRTWK